MESRQSMMIGGAAVAVITLAVASAVAITDAAALRDSSGRALVSSSITLPAGSDGAASTAVNPGRTGSQSSSVSSASTAVLVPAPVPVTVTAPAADATSDSSVGRSATTSKHHHRDTHVTAYGKAKGKKAKRQSAHADALAGRTVRRVAQTPALVAGRVSDHLEFPSSAVGSKKGQSQHSPDARG